MNFKSFIKSSIGSASNKPHGDQKPKVFQTGEGSKVHRPIGDRKVEIYGGPKSKPSGGKKS